jgi:hypothetical protein
MAEKDNFHAYIAIKCFVLISRVDHSLNRIAHKSVCKSIA